MNLPEIKARIIMSRKGMTRLATKPLKDHLGVVLPVLSDPQTVVGIMLDDLGCQVLVSRGTTLQGGTFVGTYIVNRDSFPDPFLFDDIQDPRDFLAYILGMYLEMK